MSPLHPPTSPKVHSLRPALSTNTTASPTAPGRKPRPSFSLDLSRPAHSLQSYKARLLSLRAAHTKGGSAAEVVCGGREWRGEVATKTSYIPLVRESSSQRHRRTCGRRHAPKNWFALAQAVGRRKEREEGESVMEKLVGDSGSGSSVGGAGRKRGEGEMLGLGQGVSFGQEMELRGRMKGEGEGEVMDVARTKFKQDEEIATRVMMEVDAGRLEELKAEFTKQDDGLSLEEFVKVMGKFQAKSADYAAELHRISELVELFDQVDINGDGTMEWDEFSSFVIDSSTDRDGFRVDNIKEYKHMALPCSHHSSFKRAIEHVAYMPELDKIIVSEDGSSTPQILDGTTYDKVGSLCGHAGMVHRAIYLHGRGDGSYIVTCANDSTLGFFEPERYAMCQRLPTAEVQMSLGYTGPDVDKLFSGGVDGVVNVWHPETLENLGKLSSHKGIVMDLHYVNNMDMMASAALDGKICLWDVYTGVLRRSLTGHTKGVFSLSHSEDYRFIVSAGFEHEPVVWNPYVKNVICRLSGHTASLIGVHVVENSPQIISADSVGLVKIWDVRNFSCVQTLTLHQGASLGNSGHAGPATKKTELTALGYDANHKRIVLGTHRLHVFDYEQQLDPFISDKLLTIQVIFNRNSLLLITATEASVKLWDAESGRIIKVYRNLSKSQITAAALHPRQRKFCIGDHDGQVLVYNVANGNFMQRFAAHAGEILHVGYLAKANACFSVSIDGVTRLHDMEGDDEDDTPVVLKEFDHRQTVRMFLAAIEKNASSSVDAATLKQAMEQKRHWETALSTEHSSNKPAFNICAAAESDTFGLIATAATDHTICLYAIQTSVVEGVFLEHQAEITSLLFLEPFPVLLSVDADGMLLFWSVETPSGEAQLLHSASIHERWSLQQADDRPAVTCACWQKDLHRLYLGDDAGLVRVFKLNGLQEGRAKTRQGVKQQLRYSKRRGSVSLRANLVSSHGLQRADVRVEDSNTFVTQGFKTKMGEVGRSAGRVGKRNGTLKKIQVAKVMQWEAHEDCIRSMNTFKEMNALVTSSFDKMCKVWSLNGELTGTLYQGSDEKKFADKEWIVNVDRMRQNEQAAMRARDVMLANQTFANQQQASRQRRSSLIGWRPARRPSFASPQQQPKPTPPRASLCRGRRFSRDGNKLFD